MTEEELDRKIEAYEKRVDELIESHKKCIDCFNESLKEEGLVNKTIKRHMNNINFYLNGYLAYKYEEVGYTGKLEESIDCIDEFLSYFYIYKCLFSSVEGMRTLITTLKKFYKCMYEHDYLSLDHCQRVLALLKDGKEGWLEMMDEYDRGELDFYI